MHRLGGIFGAVGDFVPCPGRDSVPGADAVFVRAEHLAADDRAGFLRLTPDPVVEVVSPADRPGEVAAETTMWLEARVRLVRVVEPGGRPVTGHSTGYAPGKLGDDDALEGGDVLPDLRALFGDTFVAPSLPLLDRRGAMPPTAARDGA